MTATLQLFPSYDALKAITRKEDMQSLTEAQLQEVAALARFLRTTPGLDKTVIGQFIAEPGPVSALLLREYLSLFDFHGQSLDDALRMFIEAFRLPVEAQQIDRVLQAFAAQYYAHNAGLLANADVVHTLAFSLIMLNTDAHNELIRQKMTVEQFVSNNRGINAGDNVPRQLLEGLYYTIKRKEIRMSGDGLTGEVNDALWTDLLMCSKTVSETRPYIRIDQLPDTVDACLLPAAARPASPQHVNGHVVGLTLYRPPIAIPLPPPAVNGHLPDSPAPVSRQVTLSELSRVLSSASVDPSSSIPSLYSLSAASAASRSCWMEEDMFMEGWHAAIAALSMVFDLLQVDREGKGVADNSAEMGEEEEGGWNKVEKDRTATADGRSAQQPDSHAQPVSAEGEEEQAEQDGSSLLSYLQQGFTLLSSVAASYSRHHVMDRIVSALCNFTGLISDYRSDSHSPSGSTPSTPVRSPSSQSSSSSFSSAFQSAVSSSSLLRFSGQAKAQWSLVLLFSLVHRHYDVLRDGWKDVLTIVLQLYGMGLLPASMLALDDHVGWLEQDGVRRKGRSRLLTHLAPASAAEESRSAVSSLFSSVSSYLLYGMTGSAPAPTAAESEAKDAEVAEAERRCQECIAQCALPQLLLNSKMMQPDALRCLVAAVMEVVPPVRVAGLAAVKSPRKAGGVVTGKGESRVCAGKEEGEAVDVSVLQEDADMVSDAVYAHEADKERVGELRFLSFPGCAACECHSLASADTPLDIRRLLLCHQLLTEIVVYNRDRADGVWPAVRHHLLSIITAPTTAAPPALLVSAAVGTHTPPSLGRSSSIPSLTSVREVSGDGDSRASAAANVLHSPPPRISPHTPARTFASSASANSLAHAATSLSSSSPSLFALPPFVVESAVASFFSIASRLLFKDSLAPDIVAAESSLTSSFPLSHSGPATQLMAGLLSLLRTHAAHTRLLDLTALLSLLSSAAAYHHCFMLGLQCLSHLLLTEGARHVSLQSFESATRAVLAYGESRWCSPVVGLALCEILVTLQARAKELLAELSKSAAAAAPENGSAHGSPPRQQRGHLELEDGRLSSPRSASSSSSSHSSPSSASSSPLRHFQYLWQHLCSPLLSAYRILIASATTRIRLLHASHLRASRTGGPGTSKGAPHSPQRSPPYIGYVGYVQGFGDVRRQLISQWRQLLIGDDFSAMISTAATLQAVQTDPLLVEREQILPSPRSALFVPSSSPFFSLTSTAFWHQCLEQQVFPALASLSSAHSVDLELTDDLTAARSACISLLEKIFLLHLPQLLRLGGGPSGHGFNACWLQVLKLMDVSLQLGVKRERLIMERKRRSVYDRKGRRRGSSAGRPPAAAAAAADSGDDYDAMDSGVMLTESVEEALKNLILVMKASGVFAAATDSNERPPASAVSAAATAASAASVELWELTWAVIDPAFPLMKLQLFPELAKSIPVLQSPTEAAHQAAVAPKPAIPAAAAAAVPERSASHAESAAPVAVQAGRRSVDAEERPEVKVEATAEDMRTAGETAKAARLEGAEDSAGTGAAELTGDDDRGSSSVPAAAAAVSVEAAAV